MYRPGHYGVALLVYAPVGAALLLAQRPDLALVGGAAMLFLTPVPDWDQRVPLVSHRGSTHTVAFAAVVGGVLAGGVLAAGATGDGGPGGASLAAFAFAVGTLSILAHLLADVVTPAGVSPFWPLSGRHYSLGLARADSTVANYLLLALGIFASVAVVFLFAPS